MKFGNFYYKCEKKKYIPINLFFIFFLFSPWAGLAGTTTQSGNQYGSGTLLFWASS
jgi:hypothetical protein